jgi:hypothetical protein
MTLIYDIGVPCRKGHTTGRYTVSRKCVQCAKDAALKWNRENPDKARKHCETYRANHPDRISAQYKNWRVSNPDKVKTKNANWQAANWDKYLAISSEWKKRNRAHTNAKSKARRLAQDQRTPKWLTEQDFAGIREFYLLADELSKAYGFPWHVDHIIPLKGRSVSGLHVTSNLQVIPGSDNMRKGNRFYG